MQIFVCGMHRSGTSFLTGLLSMMGCYFGPEGKMMPPTPANPKGYWERMDVMEINQKLLRASNGYWSKLSDFQPQDIHPQQLEQLSSQMSHLLLEMDAHRPWVLKDPRFCLTFQWWKPMISVPVAILVLRHPLEIAHSMRKRDRIPASIALTLWEEYMRHLLPSLDGLPVITTMYDHFLQDTSRHSEALYHELLENGVQDIRIPSAKELNAFADQTLKHQKVDHDRENDWGNDRQRQLWAYLTDGKWQEASSWIQGLPNEENLVELKAFEKIFDAQRDTVLEQQKVTATKEELEDFRKKAAHWENLFNESKQEAKELNFLLQNQVIDLKIVVSQQEGQLAESDKKNQELQTSIRELQTSITEKNTELSSLTNFNELLKTEKDEYLIQLHQSQAQLDKSQKEIEQMEQALLQKQEFIDELEQTIDYQQRKLKLNNDRIRLLEGEIKHVQKQIADKNKALGEYKKRNALKKDYTVELQKNIALYRKSIRYKLGNGPIDLLSFGNNSKTALDNVEAIVGILNRIDDAAV